MLRTEWWGFGACGARTFSAGRQAGQAVTVHHGLIFWTCHPSPLWFWAGAAGRWRRGSEAMEVCSVPSLLVMTGEWHAWVPQEAVNVTRPVSVSVSVNISNPNPNPNPLRHTKGRRRRGNRVARGHGGGCARPTPWAPVARRETETRAFSVLLFLFRVGFLFLHGTFSCHEDQQRKGGGYPQRRCYDRFVLASLPSGRACCLVSGVSPG